MPGLLRGIARTAVIAGTATAVSNRVSRRQAGRWARQNADEQYYAEQDVEEVDAGPEPDPMTAKLEQLRQLGELKAQGLLNEAEFEVQKSRILNT
ncbi:SHOCT domain-containing protein [Actinoplanes sp. HUAS TT8]|uniref:SHOCT domain-containing protein n=1 Tax=Actinoplanes sp. HUAS TT8 TaxID=3447453 RepID=UPI003F528C58